MGDAYCHQSNTGFNNLFRSIQCNRPILLVQIKLNEPPTLDANEQPATKWLWEDLGLNAQGSQN